MSKLVLLDLPDPKANPQGFVDTYNENLDRIEAAFEVTLSRDGSEPNLVETEIDFGGNQIINGPVIAPDIFITSRPYPVIWSDRMDLSGTLRRAYTNRGLVTDQGYLDLTAVLTGGSLEITVGYKSYSYGPGLFDPHDALDLSSNLLAGTLEITVGYKSYAYGPFLFDPHDAIDLTSDLRSGVLQIVASYIDYTNYPFEGFDLSANITGGSLT